MPTADSSRAAYAGFAMTRVSVLQRLICRWQDQRQRRTAHSPPNTRRAGSRAATQRFGI